MMNTQRPKKRPSVEYMKKIKNFIVNLIAIILIMLGIKKGLEIYAKTNSNHTDTTDSINERITKDTVTRFRDRSESSVRRVFNDRGVTPDQGNSGRTNSNIPKQPASGTRDILSRTDTEKGNGNKDLAGEFCSDLNNKFDRDFLCGPIKLNDHLLLRHIEGGMLRRHGAHFLTLLAPQQLRNGKLTPSEVVTVYRQAQKDPAVMDRYCNLGRKHPLITYHNKYVMGIDEYLEEVNDIENIGLRIYDYEIVEWEDRVFALFDNHRHELYDPHDGIMERKEVVRRWFYRRVS